MEPSPMAASAVSGGDAAAAGSMAPESKLSLPAWLKLWTDKGVDMRLAMGLAAKIYKPHPSAQALAALTVPSLQALGVFKLPHPGHLTGAAAEKEVKKVITGALRGIKADLEVEKAATASGEGAPAKRRRDPQHDLSSSPPPSASPAAAGPSPKKRPRRKWRNEGYGSGGEKEREVLRGVDDFDFGEVLDIETLRAVSVKTNRAPCMTAWAFVIAEKMGFDRVEALSLASVFTSITSTHHALALGNVYTDQQRKDAELEVSLVPGGERGRGRAGNAQGEEGGYAQPWVSIMGRNPVIQQASGSWAGLTKGLAVGPEKAYNYVTKNFGDCTPHVIGALRLLARCYTVDELNDRGYGFYVSFRPEVEGWGDKGAFWVGNIIDMIPPEAEVESFHQYADQGVAGLTEPLEAPDTPDVREDSVLNAVKVESVGEDVKPVFNIGKPKYKPPPRPQMKLSGSGEVKREPVEPKKEPASPADGGFTVDRNAPADREDVFEGLFESGWDSDT